MKSLRNLIARGGILVVMAVAVFSCGKGGEATPVKKPAENAKIVGKWHISQNAKYFDTGSSSWISVTLDDHYTSTEWDIESGVTSGKYTAKFSIADFNTNDGVWVIGNGKATLTNGSDSSGVIEFDGPITYNADGSFMIECLRIGTLVQLTFVKA